MEAANRGAKEAGGKTIGLNINLPFEQFPNSYITPSLNFEFHYFFMRKFWFAYLAKALVIFPGGFGTFDELFDILTLAQNEKMGKKILVVIYGSEYWKKLINFQVMIDAGTISAADLDLSVPFLISPAWPFCAGDIITLGGKRRGRPATYHGLVSRACLAGGRPDSQGTRPEAARPAHPKPAMLCSRPQDLLRDAACCVDERWIAESHRAIRSTWDATQRSLCRGGPEVPQRDFR